MPRAPWHVFSERPLPNRQAFQIGLGAGQLLPATTIADRVGCGLIAADVQRLWREFGFVPRTFPADQELVVVSLASKHRTKIGREAQRRGMDMPDLVSQVLSTMVRDELFGAVVEG